jgi:hypothetical protein
MKKLGIVSLWSIPITIISTGTFLMAYYMADKPSWIYTVVSYLLIAGCLLAAMFQFRNKVNGGYTSYGQAFVIGLLTTLLYSALTIIISAIFVKMHPDFIDKALAARQADMINSGVSENDMRKGLEAARGLFIPLMIIFGFIFSLIIGIVLSLIMAAITNKPKPFIEDNITPQS